MKMQTFTVEEFQSDFDNLMERVENGESFIISSEHGNAVIVPYNETLDFFEDDLVRIHTDHEEAP